MQKSPHELWAEVLVALDEAALLGAQNDLDPSETILMVQRLVTVDQVLRNNLVALRERGALDDVADLLAMTYGPA